MSFTISILSLSRGWYQSFAIGNLWIVSPLEGLEAIILTKSLSSTIVIGILIPILLAALLGRVFCSWICPVNFLYEIMDRVYIFFSKTKLYPTWERFKLPRPMLFFVLFIELSLVMIIAKPIFAFLSPIGVIGREAMYIAFYKTLSLGIIIVGIVLLMYFLSRRFFCRYFCPLGGLLSILGAKRRLVILNDQAKCKACGLCDLSCPLKLYPSQGETLSPYCWNCGSCIDACKPRSLRFVWLGKGVNVESRKERVPNLSEDLNEVLSP